MILAIEDWRDIKGYEGLYQVSNLGSVRSLINNKNVRYKTPKILKFEKDKDGYLKVTLTKHKKHKKYLISRLVAQTFIENKENKLEVNHIDGVKTNNKVINLEWSTRSENELHAYKTGLASIEKLKQKNSKPIIQIDKVTNNVIGEFKSMREAERITGVFNTSICSCCKGELKTAGGYIWRYKEVIG